MGWSVGDETAALMEGVPQTPAEAGEFVWDTFANGSSSTSVAEIYNEVMDPGEDLGGVLVGLTKDHVIGAVASSGEHGKLIASGLTAVLAVVQAYISNVPVVGWIAAAAIAVAQALTAIVQNAKNKARARKMGRSTLIELNTAAELLGLGEPVVIPQGTDWGPTPYMGGNRVPLTDEQAHLTWWMLRMSELYSIMGGTWRDKGLAGHIRHGLVADISLRKNRTQLREGHPVVRFIADQYPIDMGSGGKAKTREFGRGSNHICHEGLRWFAGSGAKHERLADRHLGAARSLTNAIRMADNPESRRGIVAAMLIAYQATYDGVPDVKLTAGAPEPLMPLVAKAPADALASLGAERDASGTPAIIPQAEIPRAEFIQTEIRVADAISPAGSEGDVDLTRFGQVRSSYWTIAVVVAGGERITDTDALFFVSPTNTNRLRFTTRADNRIAVFLQGPMSAATARHAPIVMVYYGGVQGAQRTLARAGRRALTGRPGKGMMIGADDEAVIQDNVAAEWVEASEPVSARLAGFIHAAPVVHGGKGPAGPQWAASTAPLWRGQLWGRLPGVLPYITREIVENVELDQGEGVFGGDGDGGGLIAAGLAAALAWKTLGK